MKRANATPPRNALPAWCDVGRMGAMATEAAPSTWPVETWTISTSAAPVTGALMGTRKLTCPGATKYSGAAAPLNMTCSSASVIGMGYPVSAAYPGGVGIEGVANWVWEATGYRLATTPGASA